jgi:hypothetical protein
MFFIGIFNAWLYVRKLRKKSVAWSGYLWLLANAGIWAWGICLYLNVIPIQVITPWVADGNAWMWADFFGVNFAGAAFTGTHGLAVILFLAVPCFYMLGVDAGRILYGRKTYEGGFWWALAPLKKPKAGKENSVASAGLIAPVEKHNEEKE